MFQNGLKVKQINIFLLVAATIAMALLLSYPMGSLSLFFTFSLPLSLQYFPFFRIFLLSLVLSFLSLSCLSFFPYHVFISFLIMSLFLFFFLSFFLIYTHSFLKVHHSLLPILHCTEIPFRRGYE